MNKLIPVTIASAVLATFALTDWTSTTQETRSPTVGTEAEGTKPAQSPAKPTGESRGIASETASVADAYSRFVDADGSISLPRHYKTNWAHLGSFAVAKKPGEDVTSIHDVYTQPEVIDAFRTTGRFPDGAVLVKEVRKATTGKMTTGHVAWSSEMDIWFVMIKDRKGRFQENANWGDGWGWALFEAKDPSKSVSEDYRISCIGCHVPARKNDWVYLEGYPVLTDPKRE